MGGGIVVMDYDGLRALAQADLAWEQ